MGDSNSIMEKYTKEDGHKENSMAMVSYIANKAKSSKKVYGNMVNLLMINEITYFNLYFICLNIMFEINNEKYR